MHKVECLKFIISKLTNKPVSQIEGTTICDCLHQMIECVAPKLVVNITQNEDQTYSCDKTFNEILDAFDKGKIIECKLGAYTLQPGQISENLIYFYCDIMSTSTTCLRTSVNITPTQVGVTTLHYQMTPVE